MKKLVLMIIFYINCQLLNAQISINNNSCFIKNSIQNVINDYPFTHLQDSGINIYQYDLTEFKDTVIISLLDSNNKCNFVFPVKNNKINKKTSGFGPRGYLFHNGLDISLKIRDTIVSVMEGIVRIVRNDKYGYGYFIVICHKDDLETLYGHLSKQLVIPGQYVKAGEVIGLGGNTGHSTGPHLHFEILFLGERFNPEYIINIQKNTIIQNKIVITSAYFKYLYRYKIHTNPYYIIKIGDTLTYIAKKYGTTLYKIYKLNNMDSNTILVPGKKIKLF